MPWEIYKILHFVGITMVVMSFGAIIVQQIGKNSVKIDHRRWIVATHGLGMLIILVAGFGLMAKKLQMMGTGWPIWIWYKIGIWLVLGLGVAFVLRKPYWAKMNWFLLSGIIALAAYIAIYKPV